MTNLTKLFIKIVLAVLAGALLILGVMAIKNQLSSKDVTFTFSANTRSIKIYGSDYPAKQQKANELASLNKTGTLRLTPGTYYVVPNGSNISSASIKVDVAANKDSQTVEINPFYSEKHLQQSLVSELPDIKEVINDRYPTVMSHFVMKDGALRHFGEWYTAILYEDNSSSRSAVDIYGIIMHKSDGVWKIAATPSVVFSYSDHEDIPRDIIASINQAVSSY